MFHTISRMREAMWESSVKVVAFQSNARLLKDRRSDLFEL